MRTGNNLPMFAVPSIAAIGQQYSSDCRCTLVFSQGGQQLPPIGVMLLALV